MALIDDVKDYLRVSGTDLDIEIGDLIDAAQADLLLSGILSTKVNDTSDPLIRRAISVYVKANFGYDNQEAERFQKSYDLLKAHLSMAVDYNTEPEV